jgi:manganese/zinc/iron transport system permease protein
MFWEKKSGLMMENPYAGQDFFGFWYVLIVRFFSFFLGQGQGTLASDEVQCLVLIGMGIFLAFLGCFLVLRQMTMLANALSHTILFGFACAFLLLSWTFGVTELFSIKTLIPAAVCASLLTTVITGWLTCKLRVQEDAAIGLVFTFLFALGILLVTLFTRNLHLSMEAIMGNVDALHVDDVKTIGLGSLAMVGIFCLFLRGFFVFSFDSVFMHTLGWHTKGFHFLLMMLTALGSVLAFRAVGVLLFLSLLVGPVLIARLYVHTLKKLVFLSMAISCFCTVLSVALSRHILTTAKTPVSTSGLLSTCLFTFYCVSLVGKKYRERKKCNEC